MGLLFKFQQLLPILWPPPLIQKTLIQAMIMGLQNIFKFQLLLPPLLKTPVQVNAVHAVNKLEGVVSKLNSAT